MEAIILDTSTLTALFVATAKQIGKAAPLATGELGCLLCRIWGWIRRDMPANDKEGGTELEENPGGELQVAIEHRTSRFTGKDLLDEGPKCHDLSVEERSHTIT